jgi:hypothetical protein
MKKIIKSFGLMFLVLAISVAGIGASFAQAATYTTADVALHNTSSNCWVIVNNKVYNLTNFISSHPGGSAAITAQCGKDGTASFNSGPHSASTINALNPYFLGTLSAVSPVLTSVVVAPPNPSIGVADTVQLIATPKDQNGAVFSGATTTFSSNNLAVATVNSTTGLVTGVSVGSSIITATSVKGNKTVTGTATVTVTSTPLLGNLAAEDFGVVSYDTGLGMLKGYTAGFGLTNATFAGAQSIVVKLYAGTTLLQTNTGIMSKMNADITGTQISSPLDVSGSFDYVTDGYWTNTKASEYGQSVSATKVVATVVLANGKVVTAENTILTGDPTTIFPVITGGHGGSGDDENEGIEKNENENENESMENENEGIENESEKSDDHQVTTIEINNNDNQKEESDNNREIKNSQRNENENNNRENNNQENGD